MFGKKCTLCGGKLDGNNVCTECGLDNSKSEKNYKINTASCDREPLTHVHEENEKKKKKSAPKQYHMSAEQKAPKGKSGKKLALVVSIIFLVCGIAGPVFSLITNPEPSAGTMIMTTTIMKKWIHMSIWKWNFRNQEIMQSMSLHRGITL